MRAPMALAMTNWPRSCDLSPGLSSSSLPMKSSASTSANADASCACAATTPFSIDSRIA
jgi:hypothetical protein